MKNNNQMKAQARLEQILDRLANGLSNDTEIQALRDLVWIAFEAIPADNHSKFISRISPRESSVP